MSVRKFPKTDDKGSKTLIKVELTPETWIVAPVMPHYQLLRYAKKGWLDEELAKHLDRAFPRNSEGKPVIFKLWLEAPMKRALRRLDYPKKVLDFHILDPSTKLPVEYIVIPEPPLVYRRVILNEPPSTETFEYIDSTFNIEFLVETKYPKMFMDTLNLAGRIGLLGRSKKGFGRFTVKFEV